MMRNETDTIENAVFDHLDTGYCTAGVMSGGETLVNCKQCDAIIVNNLRKE